MLKILGILLVLMFVNFWATGLSYNSCGSECVSACGTRRFRLCCFNHLRRKRGPELVQLSNTQVCQRGLTTGVVVLGPVVTELVHTIEGGREVLFNPVNLWATGLSCNSCGSECVSACGTRRFRLCCFNHLRRKRGPELVQIRDIPENDQEDYKIRKAVFIIQDPEYSLRSLTPDVIRPYTRAN